MLASLPLVFVLAGLVFYTVLGGADFGGGFWQLFAGRGAKGERVREFAHLSMGPVWEANHVWLIFVITVFWTAYPTAFGSIASTLAIPLFLALIGIILRGAAYALRAGAENERESGRIDTLFSLSSILTPFALGTAVGAIATDRVPVGNAAGDLWSSWLNTTSIFIGVLAVASCAYLAAVYLAADAHHDGSDVLEGDLRLRALAAGLAAGAIAIAGIFVVKEENHRLYHLLTSGRALPAVIVSAGAGIAALALVYGRRFEWARYSAALAVAAVVAGWGLARWPEILPGLTVHEAAAGHDTLVALVVAVLAGGAILFPALAFLFRLALTGRFRAAEHALPEQASSEHPPPGRKADSPRLLARLAAACLVAGFGLLNVANAAWAHAIGLACLVAFVILAFRVIVSAGLAEAGAGW